MCKFGENVVTHWGILALQSEASWLSFSKDGGEMPNKVMVVKLLPFSAHLFYFKMGNAMVVLFSKCGCFALYFSH